MSNSAGTQADEEGEMDPSAKSDTSITAELDTMFASFEDELKPLEVNMPSVFDLDMEIGFNPVSVKSEILPIEDDCWENDLLSDPYNYNFSGGVEQGFATTDHDQSAVFQMNDITTTLDGPSHQKNGGNGNGNGQGLYRYYPNAQYIQTFAPAASLNRWIPIPFPIPRIHPNVVERRRKRMIKNRESAARSRARRMAYNTQQKIEIQRLKEENEFLKRVLHTLLAIVGMNIRHEAGSRRIHRTFSAPATLPASQCKVESESISKVESESID